MDHVLSTLIHQGKITYDEAKNYAVDLTELDRMMRAEMVVYSYVAKSTETNEIVRAEVQAENEQAAAKLLVGQKLFPISIEPKGDSTSLASFQIGSGVPAKARIIFTRQLSTLIGAGLPLLQSLRTVHDQISNKQLQTIVSSITTAVEGVNTLGCLCPTPQGLRRDLY